MEFHGMRWLLMAALLSALLHPAKAAAQQQEATQAAPARNDDGRVPLTEIRRFVSVFNAVRAAYVEPVEEKRLMQAAVKGLLLDLDPHSVYFDAVDAKSFSSQAEGSYEGIGVEVSVQEDLRLRVIAPIEGGPAEKAGIRAGDLIISVDGKEMKQLQGSEPLRGPAGTAVRLGILREGLKSPLSIEVARQSIQLSSIRSRMLEPAIGYVRISNFQADTGADFNKHVEALKRSNAGLKALLVDLRGNPGGLLTAAVDVADSLLDSGVIVSTRGRLSVSDTQFEAAPGQLLDGVEVVVLVDAGSASASEVLAGALRDNGRATVTGSQTFGKGSVQTVLPLDNGDAVKLTTARYYTPSGRSIQGVGITPDHLLVADENGDALADYSESALSGHLEGEEEGREETAAPRGVILSGDQYIQQAREYIRSSILRSE